MSNQYLILDAARCGIEAVEHAGALSAGMYSSLYGPDEKEDYMAVVAPYVFSMNTNLISWYGKQGWNNAWGFIFVSQASLEDVYVHLQRFIIRTTADGQEMYFRFYDPRVLKNFLPACGADQAADFFGPIEKFIVEENKGGAIEFSLQNAVLNQRKINTEEIFGKLTNPTAGESAVQKIKRNMVDDDPPHQQQFKAG